MVENFIITILGTRCSTGEIQPVCLQPDFIYSSKHEGVKVNCIEERFHHLSPGG